MVIGVTTWIYTKPTTKNVSSISFPVTGYTMLSLAFSPDGKTLASGGLSKSSSLGKMSIWNIGPGERIAETYNDMDWVLAVAFSPDNNTIAIGNRNKTVLIWDRKTVSIRSTLRGHASPITSVTFSGDGQILASSDMSGAVRLWDSKSGKLHRILKVPGKGVYSIAFSPRGDLLATGGGSYSDKATMGEICLFDRHTGKLEKVLRGHHDWVNSVCFSPDGRTLVSGSDDKTVKTWDTKAGTVKQTLNNPNKQISSVAFSPNGKLIAAAEVSRSQNSSSSSTQESKGHIFIWESATGVLSLSYQGDTQQLDSLRFSPEGTRIGVVDGGTPRIWVLPSTL